MPSTKAKQATTFRSTMCLSVMSAVRWRHRIGAECRMVLVHPAP